ncbi:MAG: peptidylprolyl isomerase [Nitrospirota bacterium]
MLKTLKIFFFLFLALSAFVYAFAEMPKESNENIVARVNGAVITKDDLALETNKIIPQTYYHGNVSQEKRKEAEKKALENLINNELFYQEAKKQGIKADKDAVKKMLEATKKRYPSEEAFNQALKKQNLTISIFEEKIEKILLVDMILQKEVMITFTEQDISDYYNNNKAKFMLPESVKLKYIWIKRDPTMPDSEKSAGAKADEAMSELKAGKDFSEVAQKYSADASRVMGGDIGFIHSGRLPEEVESIAYKLKTGDISGKIKTDKGYHIIRVDDRRPAKLMQFEEIKDKLKKELTESRQEERRNTLVERLRNEAKVEILLQD